MTDTAQATVNTLCKAYTDMQLHWTLIDDLMGGTLAMRDKDETWLPREPEEEVLKYNIRKNRSTLFTAYSDTIDDLRSKPFSQPIQVKQEGNLPDQLKAIPKNCDGRGTDINQFARDLFTTGANRGIFHILVDMPNSRKLKNGETLTLADEQKMGVRPYFVIISADSLLSWRYDTGPNGQPRLMQIVWKSPRIEPDGPYGEKTVDEIRVMTAGSKDVDGTWEVHRANEKGEYSLADNGTHTYKDGLPFVTKYFNKTGFMQAMPPLEGLAWLNLDHWQVSSDYKNLIRFVCFPILFGKGISSEDFAKAYVGPGAKFSTNDPNGDAKYVEHTGAGAAAAERYLASLVERMIMAGLEPLITKPGNETATGQAIAESKAICAVQAWVRCIESALLEAFEIAAKWIGQELPTEFSIDIFDRFGLSLRDSQELQILLQTWQAKGLSLEAFLTEYRRRGVLPESFDVEKEAEDARAEGPNLAEIGFEDASQHLSEMDMSDDELLAKFSNKGLKKDKIKMFREYMQMVTS